MEKPEISEAEEDQERACGGKRRGEMRRENIFRENDRGIERGETTDPERPEICKRKEGKMGGIKGAVSEGPPKDWKEHRRSNSVLTKAQGVGGGRMERGGKRMDITND